ncbi:hypothetical protein CDL15_Pgr010505 [Punica granatum]|uniref:protein-serine/threonine phosphatase n=1 Tax=Punica granatum TaxID=22663 RepID=A0A218XWR2_PUNGR|nr:hypothetical protein CDL15_Pgr010505 [Punica granatum]
MAREVWPWNQVRLTEAGIRKLCMTPKQISLQQPNWLELKAPIKICGDIHGQYAYLLRLFELGGFPPKTNYLFLRNHIGYGKQSLATICLLFAYKIKHPDNFFLLRGDHECAPINLQLRPNKKYSHPAAVPDTGLLCDLLWSDPDSNMERWGKNDGGVSYTFGANTVSQFLVKCDLELVGRAHQVIEDGFGFFATRDHIFCT